MEAKAMIMHFIDLIWLTGILEQRYKLTAITVTKFEAGPKLEMESHKFVFWDLYFFFIMNS
jgi:hypothetical protein